MELLWNEGKGVNSIQFNSIQCDFQKREDAKEKHNRQQRKWRVGWKNSETGLRERERWV